MCLFTEILNIFIHFYWKFLILQFKIPKTKTLMICEHIDWKSNVMWGLIIVKMSVSLHVLIFIWGMTREMLVPHCLICICLSKIIWNGNALQNVLGDIICLLLKFFSKFIFMFDVSMFFFWFSWPTTTFKTRDSFLIKQNFY